MFYDTKLGSHESKRPTANKAGRIVPKFFATMALIATAALTGISAQATTYYVSSSGGNDGNNGTSTATPWQTTDKVNNFALNPGDVVNFKRGDNWYSQLSPTRSGAQGNSITFADYGSGNKPTIWGSNPIPNASFSPAGTNQWTAPFTAPGNASVGGVIVNGYVAPNGAWLVPGNPANPGQFSSGGGTITIYSTTDPRTNGFTYTGDSRQDVIFSNGQSHLIFNNLIARESSVPDFGYVIRVQNSADVVFNSCEAYCGSKHLWGFINATGVVANNCDAEYGLPNNQANGCTFYVSYADQSGPYNNCTSVYNNCSGSHFDTGVGDGSTYQYFVCHGPNQGAITFNNPIDNGGLFSVLEDAGVPQPVVITGGTITNGDLEVYAHDMVTTGVTFVGECSIDNYGQNNVYQNCKMINMLEPAGGKTAYWTAILMRPGATGNILRFNTIVMDPSTGNGTTCVAMPNHGTTTQAYGNIFLSHTGKVVNVWQAGASSPPNNTDVTNWDYNWYQSSPTPIFDFDNISFATWKTDTGADAHTLTGDPIFNNPAGNDYTLSNTSPALNTVAITSETPALPTTDFAGQPRKFGAAYDPGAYELQANQVPPSAPVITSASSATGTTGSAFSYQITASNHPTSFGASPLPSGLSVNTSTGLISGTPNTAATTNTTVSATNAGGTGTLVVAITISLAKPVITSSATASGTAGSSFSYQITASGSPTSFGATPLPAGVSVNTGNGLISGTPTSAGTTNTVVSATNSAGTGTKTVVITISNVSALYNIHAIFTTGTAVTNGGADSFGNAYQSNLMGSSATFNNSSFTFGNANQNDAFNNETVPLPAGNYTVLNMLASSTGGNVTAQTFVVHYTDGTTSTFTQDLHDWESNGTYTGESTVVTMATHLNTSGAAVTPAAYVHGYSFTLNGKSVASITLPATRQVIAFGFAAGSTTPIPSITSALTKSGTVGTALSYTITATNSPTSYGATPLPGGLTVNTSTGVISGTPTAAGTTNTTISATNANGTGSATLVFTIASNVTPFNINAIFTTGTAVTNGGADSYGDAYESDQLGTSATFDTQTFTFGAANALDGWSNTTVNLPAGSYTTLDMVGSAVGGNVTAQTFTVTYTDLTTSTFTINLRDWESTTLNAGEVKVVTMADHLNTSGASVTPGCFLHGYTFTLNGKAVKSITLPATRQVIALGFAGH